MQVVVYLEPFPYRGTAMFLRGHLDAFVIPIVSALAYSAISCDKEVIDIRIVSNSQLSLEAARVLQSAATHFCRTSSKTRVRTSTFSVNIIRLLRKYGNSIAEYSQDVYVNRSISIGHRSSYWRQMLNEAFSGLSSPIVVTTSSNRYLATYCRRLSLPLISCEYGPLPRMLYPENRFLSLVGHLNSGIISSLVNAISKSIPFMSSDSNAAINAGLMAFIESYHSSIKLHPKYKDVLNWFHSRAPKNTIACLALQPESWITWEGATGKNSRMIEIVLQALSIMKSDFLVITFHADLTCDIDSSIMTELQLSDSRILLLPPEIARSCTEIILPFIDELITVSSNTALTSFLLGCPVKSLGFSFVSDLQSLQNKYRGHKSLPARAAVLSYLLDHYYVDPSLFSSPSDLAEIISRRFVAHGLPSLT